MLRHPEIDWKRLGRNIRRARVAVGWTQEDLAFQVSNRRNYRPNVAAAEKGKRKLPFAQIHRIAYYCRVGMDWLLENDD